MNSSKSCVTDVASRISAIDALRGISVLAVVLLHAREILWVGVSALWQEYGLRAPLHAWLGYATVPFRYGHYAVMVFFVLSGYCIHRSNVKRLHGPFNFLTYNRRRFYRIYPVLAAALVLTALIDSYVRSRFPSEYKLGDDSFLTFIANLLSLQNIVRPCYGSNGPLWSLSIEIHLYAIYPLLLRMRKSLGAAAFVWVPLMVTSAMLLVHRACPTLPPNALSYLFVWSLGCYVAEVEAAEVRLPQLPYAAIGLIALVLGLAFGSQRHFLVEHVFVGVSSAVLLGWTVRGGGTRFYGSAIGKFFCWLGVFSYSVYATHLPLLLLFKCCVLQGEPSHFIYWTAVGVLFCMCAGWLFFNLIERFSITPHRTVDTIRHNQLFMDVQNS